MMRCVIFSGRAAFDTFVLRRMPCHFCFPARLPLPLRMAGLQGCASASTAARLYSSLRYVPLGTRTGTAFPLLQLLGEC